MPGVIDIGLAVARINIPRAEPCSALVLPKVECGATPASLYLRYCTVPSHARKVWLCPVHASLVSIGGSICRECASRGGVSPVLIVRLTEPVRL